jgi:hypothetical protein
MILVEVDTVTVAVAVDVAAVDVDGVVSDMVMAVAKVRVGTTLFGVAAIKYVVAPRPLILASLLLLAEAEAEAEAEAFLFISSNVCLFC